MHFFRVALFSSSNFFVFDSFHYALSLCCTFLCCTFLWCTLSMLQCFRIGLLWYFTISFTFNVIFVLHFFSFWTFSILHSFHITLVPCCCFSVLLYSHAALLRWLFSCCTLFMLRELLENLGAIAFFSCAM